MSATTVPVRRSRLRPLTLLLVLGLCGGGIYALNQWRMDPGTIETLDETELDKTFTLERGEFNVTVLTDGMLNAIERYDVICEVRKGRISKIVDDRTYVAKGQMIVELDREPWEDELEAKRLELEEAQKELSISQEDLKMTRARNLSDIKNAADQLRTAREVLEKYLDLDYSKKREDLQSSIRAAEEAVTEAEEELSAAEESLEANPFNDEAKLADLENVVSIKRDALDKAEQSLATQTHAYRVFRQYDHPQKLRELKEAVGKANLNLQQAIVSAKGKVVQSESRISSYNRRIESIENDITEIQGYLDKMTLYAPVSGVITFGNPHRRHWQEPKDYKVGTELDNREIAATIPDLSRFLVEVDIPEEYRGQIEKGLKASLRCPAIPSLRMTGEISRIALMAERVNRRDPSSPKVYPTEIVTDAKHAGLMPGMSINVEIVVETVRDVLYVPIEAVYNREGKKYCRVKTPAGSEERAVDTGRMSVHFVEITDGLSEGEEVLLFRRASGSES